MELALYCISQELIYNIMKHSGASEASLPIKRQVQEILLEAKDNEKGFDIKAVTNQGLGYKPLETV